MSQNSDPSPIERLDYALPGRSRRPTVLTALSVLSIVMACFTVATSGFMGYGAARESIDFQANSTPSATWSPPAAPLTPHQIDVVRKQIDAPSRQMNAKQAEALHQYLASPAQALFYPASDRALAWQIHSIGSGPYGKMDFKTMRGALTLPSGGGFTVKLESQAYAQSDPKPFVQPALMSAAACEIVSLFLALALLWGAIQLLRHSSRGYNLHHFYALSKIPLAIVATVAWFVVLQDNWFGELGVLVAMAPSFIGLGYAVIVLSVLRSPPAREWKAQIAAFESQERGTRREHAKGSGT